MKDIIDCCHAAMQQECVLVFTYTDAEGVTTERIVEPQAIEGVSIMAWCLHRTEVRRFKMRRMTDVRVGPPHHEMLLPLPELESVHHDAT